MKENKEKLMEEFIKVLKKETDYKLKKWNPEKFNWEKYSNKIARFCKEYIEMWWDSEKFDWRYSWYLAKYCNDQIEIWWDPERWDWERNTDTLCYHCSKHVNKWFDINKFNKSFLECIYVYCSDYMSDKIRNELTLLKLGEDV